MAPVSPVVAAHELGRRLRERREMLGLGGAELARVGQCTPQFLSQVETGKKIPAIDKLRAIADRLEFGSPETEELLALREQGTQRGPFAAFSGIFPAEVMRFFGFEYGAESISSFTGGLIHGLLQTADYARAVMQTGGPAIRQAEAERRVQARLVRQQRLTGPEPLSLSVVMGEAAIRQQVGGPDVLAAQLAHLVRQVEQHHPRIEVRVVPFTSRGHPAMGSAIFYVLEFPTARLPGLLWLDTVIAPRLIDDPILAHEYSLVHAAAAAAALDVTASIELIEHAAREIS